MPCNSVRMPGGGSAIVCTRGGGLKRCSVAHCHKLGVRQCDFPSKPDGLTCDRYLCREHTVSVRRGVDFCPEHADEAAQLRLPLERLK